MASTETAPFIDIHLVFVNDQIQIDTTTSTGCGYAVDIKGNIVRHQPIPNGETGRISFHLHDATGEAEFTGIQLAETQAELPNLIPVLNTYGEFYGSTPFQVSHDAVQAPQELHVCEGPYTEQLVPIEGWYYKVGATINGTQHTLDPRIYNQGETGEGPIERA